MDRPCPSSSPLKRSKLASEKSPRKSRELQEESNELTITIKVMKFFFDSPVGAEEKATGPPEETETTKLGPPRPSGCPTNFQMVDMILASAEKEGKDGLTISEIISEMRTRYWPGLKDVQVSAPIYAFVRQGRFKKKGGKFKRIKKTEGSEAAAPEPS